MLTHALPRPSTHRTSVREFGENGFTLLEMLIVVVIIGILAAISVPVYLNQRQEANDASLNADIGTLSSKVGDRHSFNPDMIITTSSFPEAAINKDTDWIVKDSQEKGWCIAVWNPKSSVHKTADTAVIYELIGSNACATFGMTGTPWGGA